MQWITLVGGRERSNDQKQVRRQSFYVIILKSFEPDDKANWLNYILAVEPYLFSDLQKMFTAPGS